MRIHVEGGPAGFIIVLALCRQGCSPPEVEIHRDKESWVATIGGQAASLTDRRLNLGR